MQQSPGFQHFVERLAGEELDGSAQHRSFCAKHFGKGLTGEAGGAIQIGDDVFQNRDVRSACAALEVELLDGDDGVHKYYFLPRRVRGVGEF